MRSIYTKKVYLLSVIYVFFSFFVKSYTVSFKSKFKFHLTIVYFNTEKYKALIILELNGIQ